MIHTYQNFLKYLIEDCKKNLGFYSGIALTIGAAILLLYLSQIKFFPSDISIADTIFIPMIIMAFVGLMLVVTVILYMAAIPVSHLIVFIYSKRVTTARKLNKSFFKVRHPFALLGLILFVLIVTQEKNSGLLWVILMLAAIDLPFYEDVTDENSEKHSKFLFQMSVMVLPIVLIFSSQYVNYIEKTFEILSIRQNNVDIRSSDQYCEHYYKMINQTSSNNCFFKGAKVVFRGVGSTSLIEIDRHRIVIPNNDFVIGFEIKNSKS